MAEPRFIDPAAPVSPGLDFVALRTRGIEIVQQLAGESWTDYNEHDPGVTTLEQLCYALTEVAYRAELPIEDLLTDPRTGAINSRRQRLFAPDAVLPSNPLTDRDYRKLIVDRVAGVANAWLCPRAPASAGAVNGLYEIAIYAPDAPREEAGAIGERVRRVYSSVRSVCEDVDDIYVLEPIPATIGARVSIDPAAMPERVLARMLYEAGQWLAPEIRRQPLDDVMAGRPTLASIFSGPLLRRGFISDDQLQPRPDRFTVGDVTRVLQSAQGVVAVRDLAIDINGAQVDTGKSENVVVVPPKSLLRLDTRLAAWAGLRLFVNDHECRLNAPAVQRELDRLWIDHRRTYDLQPQYERTLALPKGRPIDVGEYYSIQNQFPAVYGINEHGVSSEATEARQAQARQFKAYLLVFEQLLADAGARLASATRGAFRGPSHQYLDLDTSVPDVAPLLKPSYRAELARLAGDRDNALERRTRLLDLMLATYGETVEPIEPPPTSGVREIDSPQGAVQVRGRLEMLRRLPWLRSRRGTACDYLAPPSPANAAGFEITTRLQLGMSGEAPRPIDTLLTQLGIRAIVEAAPIAHRESMRRHARHIAGTFRPLPHLATHAAFSDTARDAEINEELLVAAADPDHYRVGALPGETDITLVCRAPGQTLWQFAGSYPDEQGARAGASVLMARARALDRHARRLYIVEHTLLRFGGAVESPGPGEAGFEHSFTLSAIVGVPAREAHDPAYRRRVCEVLRENTPAHIVTNGCFLKLSHLAEFERRHAEWRRTLATPQESHALASRCREMRAFLMAERP